MKFFLDVEVHDPATDPQEKYLVHGYDDVYWVDGIDAVLQVIRQELEREVSGEIP